MTRAISVAMVALLMPYVVAAQRGEGRGTGTLVGTVLDSISDTFIPRTGVCAWQLPVGSQVQVRCSGVDSAGRYQINDLTPDRLLISVTCSTLRRWGGIRLAADSVDIVQNVTTRRDWTVSRAGCDPRPLRRVTGTFRGQFTTGFEESRFVPCEADAWFLPGDSLHTYPYDAREAWLELSERARSTSLPWPPNPPRDEYGSARYFVHVKGFVQGPGTYGHLGVSVFQLVVDSVLRVALPNQADCR